MPNLLTGSVLSDGTKIHYSRISQGNPTLIFLHGIMDNGMCMGSFAVRFYERYDVLLPDFRGHGLSDKPNSGYTQKQFTNDIFQLITDLEIEKPILIGHAMGASIAFQMACNFPDLAAGIVLIDPPWYDPNVTHKGFAMGKSLEFFKMLPQLKQKDMAELRTIAEQMHPNWDEREYFQWCKAKQQVSPLVLQILPYVGLGWQHAIASVKIPALLLTGSTEHGSIVSAETAETALAGSKNFSTVHMKDAGHCIFRDQPIDAYTAVNTFVRNVYYGI